MSDDVWLVVGLGNPGPTYAGHRHNIGYMVVEELAARMRTGFRAHKTGRAETVEGRFGPPGDAGRRVVLAKSRTYMNESGGPVKALATFYKVPPERIIAIHDELDIPFSAIRVKLGGGDNGHNGLPGRQDVADFVLSNYSSVERKELPLHVVEVADAVESLVTDGLEKTQQNFNR
jgi:PTH1 family peptidyl-tRNA hydrolase